MMSAMDDLLEGLPVESRSEVVSALRAVLGVDAATIAQHGAVSEAVVREMAQGAVRHSRAHVSIAISGIAGPDGGTPDKPVGTVWFAWGQKRGYVEPLMHRLTGDRATIRARAVVIALDGLRQRLSQ